MDNDINRNYLKIVNDLKVIAIRSGNYLEAAAIRDMEITLEDKSRHGIEVYNSINELYTDILLTSNAYISKFSSSKNSLDKINEIVIDYKTICLENKINDIIDEKDT